jgi:hypothetical protein
VLLLLGAGCAHQDPIDRPGTWRATGANDHNLRAMIVNPADLTRGATASMDRGNAGANAATRLFIEQRRALPTLSSSQVISGDSRADPPLAGLAGGGSNGAR